MEFNITVLGYLIACDFELKNPYTYNYTAKVDNEIILTIVVMGPRTVIAGEGMN